jgi:hypothetical protein
VGMDISDGPSGPQLSAPARLFKLVHTY